MTAPVLRCPDHGFHDDSCPDCGAEGEPVLRGARRRQLSTFLSGALRHFPDDVGLTLDAAGWIPWDALVDSVERRYGWAGEREVAAVVATDPKGRFETRSVGDGRAIRAAYGHSVDVDLDAELDLDVGTDTTEAASRDSGTSHSHDRDTAGTVPETLYHGTAPRNVDAILDEGLRPMGRQLVHLSGSRQTARSVGQRHTDGDPVVLVVDADGLAAAGFELRKRGVDTYTVDRVPPAFLTHPTNV